MNKGLFDKKTILISGATGLIGKELVKYIFENSPKARVIALVRDAGRAQRIFANLINCNIVFWESDVCALTPVKMDVDYIIHGASQTSSKAFVEKPVETIQTGIRGTSNMLEIARLSQPEAFVFLSTMEVYGAPSSDEIIYENHSNNIDSMAVRSCYPESKRICENLCTAYASEYGVNAKVARLTQTFGRGVAYDDGRVFAEFARCAIEGRDIVLKTKGDTKRCYLSIEDAVRGILTILVYGRKTEAYNVANQSTYCSILEMANMVAKKYGVKVIIDESQNSPNMGYAPTLCMNLACDKLEALGWKAQIGLEDIYSDMIEDMRSEK